MQIYAANLHSVVGDVLDGDGAGDMLADGHLPKVDDVAAVVGDHHQLWLHHRAVNLQVQSVVDAADNVIIIVSVIIIIIQWQSTSRHSVVNTIHNVVIIIAAVIIVSMITIVIIISFIII